MGGNGDLTATERPEQRTLSDTVLANQAVAMSIGQRQGGVRQHPISADRDIDTVDLDVLALRLGVRTQLERVYGHEKLLVRLGVVGLSDQLRGLVLYILHDLLFLLRTDLQLSLLQLLLVYLRLQLPGVGGLEVDGDARQAQRRRGVALRADMDGLVQLLCRKGHLPLLGVQAIGGAEVGHELFHQITDGAFILRTEVPRGRDQQRHDGVRGLGQR